MTDIQTPVSDTANKVIKFGINQLNKPTPMILKYIFRTVSFLSGLWALLSGQFTHLTPEMTAEIFKWLLIANTAMHYAIKFFGWNYTDETVQIDQKQ